MDLTTKQERRILQLKEEGRQRAFDKLVADALGWEVATESQGPSAYVNNDGYKVNNLAAWRMLIQIGVDPIKELGIHFKKVM